LILSKYPIIFYFIDIITYHPVSVKGIPDSHYKNNCCEIAISACLNLQAIGCWRSSIKPLAVKMVVAIFCAGKIAFLH
jgi:hypothetical protein